MIDRKFFPKQISQSISLAFLKPGAKTQRIISAEKPNWAPPFFALLGAGALQAGLSAHYHGIESQLGTSLTGILFAMIAAVGGVVIFWLVESEVVNIFLLLNGGRTSINHVKTLIAWAYFPFVLREIERSMYMLLTGQTIEYPGLSAAAALLEDSVGLWMRSSLSQIDIFFCWHMVLILIAARTVVGGSKSRLVAAIFFFFIVWVLLKGAVLAGFSLLTQ